MKVLIIARHIDQGLGGIEIQCDLIARELSSIGHTVSYAAPGLIQGQGELPYELLAWHPQDACALSALIARFKPDIIYLRNNKNGLRLIAKVAQRKQVPLVFAVSSLQDVQPWSYHKSNSPASMRRLVSVAWQRIKSRWNWQGFRYVSAVVCLNPDYTDHLPVENRVHIPDSMDSAVTPFFWPRPYVAWVAQLKDYKHPEAYVELARRCFDLDIDFLMVGGLIHENLRWIAEQIGTPRKFHYLGTMTPKQVNGFLAGSELMVHTCAPEGFGNNFIQAWQQGKATLSLQFDPGGVIERHDIGAIGGDIDGLERQLRRLLANEDAKAAMESRALKHASQNYNPHTNVKKLESVFQEMLQAGGRQ